MNDEPSEELITMIERLMRDMPDAAFEDICEMLEVDPEDFRRFLDADLKQKEN
jgi:hypothetical protein